jgi:hypothetical protein
MATIQKPERKEVAPDKDLPHDVVRGRSSAFGFIAVVLAALVGFGVGWLVFRDTGSGVPSVATEFPTGRFVNDQFENRFFEFDTDGTYLYSESTGPSGQVSGTYGVRGDLYTEMTHDYPGLPKVPVTYGWTLDGEELTFELVGEDVVSHREGVYGDSVYVRGD